MEDKMMKSRFFFGAFAGFALACTLFFFFLFFYPSFFRAVVGSISPHNPVQVAAYVDSYGKVPRSYGETYYIAYQESPYDLPSAAPPAYVPASYNGPGYYQG
jgi:hypothetical protein